MSERKKGTIAVLHGPNLDRLGSRDPRWYGTATLATINEEIRDLATSLGYGTEIHQTNIEREMIDRIHAAGNASVGIIMNAGAWTHTSHAIRDAVSQVTCPVIEVHLSNVYAREKFRHVSVLEDLVAGKILGFGKESYLLGIRAISSLHEGREQTK